MAFPLRPSKSPDFSDYLVHFTGRSGNRSTKVPPGIDILGMSPQERLQSILAGGAILGTQPFGTSAPVVCFSEATTVGLEHLIGDLKWEPWGLVFRRQFVYEKHGGPVFHYRPDEWTEEWLQRLPGDLRARFIRFEAERPGVKRSEWLWEREWRVVTERLEFRRGDVVAVIIGERWWPGLVEVKFDDDQYGETVDWYPPSWMPDCLRWWWNHDEGRLDPIETYFSYLPVSV
jgi:hypothetical protein